MPKVTAFHSRLEPLNQTKIWKNWSGYLVAPQYQYSIAREYYAVRSSVSLLDTSPLFKYRIGGHDADKLLEYALARDIRKCPTGSAQYTVWCDHQGFVVQDGVVIHVEPEAYYLTAAEPALRYFRQLARQMNLSGVVIEDVSTRFGILALQGPHAVDVMRRLSETATSLPYFGALRTTIGKRPAIISRTGFTGDLGYEIWVEAEQAVALWDALMIAGEGYGITPIGTTALKMARVEAGLLLLGVDFESARHAWVDEQRETPLELGWKWMFRNLADDNRDFLGRSALEKELATSASRWTTVGLEIDVREYERAFTDAGIAPPKQSLYREATMSLYRRGGKQWDYVGYASSFLYSSLLKKPIALAKLPLELATNGTEVDIEISVIRKPVTVLARVVPMPFYRPLRKTAVIAGGIR